VSGRPGEADSKSAPLHKEQDLFGKYSDYISFQV